MHADGRCDVSILIVSYNTREMSEACLNSILAATTSITAEVIVVDNASSDGSKDMLERHPAVSRLIALDNNIGFARGTNLAGEYARGRYVLLLNPDTVILDGAIERLLAFADANKEALIWGGRTLFADGTLNFSSCWQRMTVWNQCCRILGLTSLVPASAIFNGEAYGGWQRNSVRQVDIVSGCLLLMPTTVWTALGGFDEVFFMYGEDADLCLRAHRIGARPLITPDAVIVHHGGASETTRADKFIKLMAAKVTLVKRYWRFGLKTIGVQMMLSWPLSRWLALEAAARLMRRDDLKARANVWKEIFDRRLEWKFGYTKPELTGAERQARTPIVAGAR